MSIEPFIYCRGKSACAILIRVVGRASMISATDLRSRPFCDGIALAKMLSVACQSYRPTWGMFM
jgi:hypothetical protein